MLWYVLVLYSNIVIYLLGEADKYNFFYSASENVTRHNKTGQLSVTKKNVIFLLSEEAFYQLKDDNHSCVNWMQHCNFMVKNKS